MVVPVHGRRRSSKKRCCSIFLSENCPNIRVERAVNAYAPRASPGNLIDGVQVMLEASPGKVRILVVDDEPEIRDVLCELLGDHHECVPAASAEEALQLIRGGRFGLIISDIMMGGMSGLEMIPHVLNDSPDTVVLMISGVQTIESAIKALRAGAFDYIMKPFDLRQVELAVNRALEYYDLRRAKQLYEAHLEELVEQRTAELDKALDSVEDAYRSTLKALAHALETRDAETHGDSERVV